MEKDEFQEKIVNHFKFSMKRKTELLDKLTEFIQENEITKEEWKTLVNYLEGKE